MNQTKTNYRLTQKWLRTNKYLWCKKAVKGHMVIVLKKPVKMPNYVKYYIEITNKEHMGKKDALANLINTIEFVVDNQKSPEKETSKKQEDDTVKVDEIDDLEDLYD